MDFIGISIVLVTAAVFGIGAKMLKQPLLTGYLFAGFFLASTGLITDFEALESLGQIGVALLLFLLGLEMNVKDLSSTGKVALLLGLGQMIITSTIGFGIALLFGIDVLPAVYISVAMTFSSTIIVVKLLSEKKKLSSLYGKIAVGALLVQDFAAILILMFLSGLGSNSVTVGEYLILIAKVVLLFGIIYLLSKKILPRIFSKVANSNELLFIVSIAWALGVAAFVAGPLGFSPEIGGFLAGLALSNLPSHLKIAAKTKPLRDFFLVIFFLLLGTRLIFDGNIIEIFPEAITFTIFVLVGIPIIVLAVMGYLGYKKRTSFLVGLTVAQISEFSFIMMAVGYSLGHVDNLHVSLVVWVGVITMTVSTYMISASDKLYEIFKRSISMFERKVTVEEAYIKPTEKSDHIVLVGSDITGTALATYLIRQNKDFVVIDFDPRVFKRLTAVGISVIFGDVCDDEITEAANIKMAKMVISTVTDLGSDLALLEDLRESGSVAVSVFTARDVQDAIRLYEAGATYVVVPEAVAGEHIRHVLGVYGTSYSKFERLGKGHFNRVMNQG